MSVLACYRARVDFYLASVRDVSENKTSVSRGSGGFHSGKLKVKWSILFAAYVCMRVCVWAYRLGCGPPRQSHLLKPFVTRVAPSTLA